MRRRLFMVLLALVAGLAAPAVAAPEGPPVHFRGDEVVRARLLLDSRTISAGGSTDAAVELTPTAGWHLYGPEHGDAGAPPEITWMLPHGVHAGAIVYPPSKRVVRRGLMTFEYRGRTTLRVLLSAAAGTQPLRDGVLQADVTWFVCSNVCVPGRATLRVALDVVPATTGAPYFAWAGVGKRRSSAARSHFPRSAAASYVDAKKSSTARSGSVDVRTASYGSTNSLSPPFHEAASGATFAFAKPGGSG
jgi:thiol:disulfide interchange protein DsbD